MIELTKLKKTFGEKVAVDIDNFVINDGDILGLVGNNGAGKTTLFRLILDLLKADEGTVSVSRNVQSESLNPAETEDWKEFTGAFINDGFLIDFLTPEEYFEFIADTSAMDKETYESRLANYNTFMAGEIIGQKKLIRDLSAGNKQKVGIISAMLSNPDIVILDEPFNFLDPSSQNVLKNILIDYQRQTGSTMLVSSHNLAYTIDVSTRIALMEQGRIIRDIDNHNLAAKEELEQYFLGNAAN